jgi:hypothetical protein
MSVQILNQIWVTNQLKDEFIIYKNIKNIIVCTDEFHKCEFKNNYPTVKITKVKINKKNIDGISKFIDKKIKEEPNSDIILYSADIYASLILCCAYIKKKSNMTTKQIINGIKTKIDLDIDIFYNRYYSILQKI